jgi:hypothetical protein
VADLHVIEHYHPQGGYRKSGTDYGIFGVIIEAAEKRGKDKKQEELIVIHLSDQYERNNDNHHIYILHPVVKTLAKYQVHHYYQSQQ